MKKIVYVGNVQLGDGKVYIQSMTNTDTKDVAATVAQVNALAKAGAALVRVSVPDEKSAEALKQIVNASPVPIVADIHYSAKPALIAIRNGAKKIRINPYNMSEKEIGDVVRACKEYDVPIRVGVNKGSGKERKTPAELAQSAVECAQRIESYGFDKIVLAVKTSDVRETVEAYRILAQMTEYPLHVGLTEAGTEQSGSIKSAIAIGSLLLDGIGDTVRVSLAGDPVNEITMAKRMLRAVGIDKDYVQVIACPTCARTEIEVSRLAEKVEKLTENVNCQLKIAVMGCAVNGIGESRDADLGVAGGKDKSVLFENGKIVATVRNDRLEEELMKLIGKRIHG